MTALHALLAFTAWTLLLVTGVLLYRGVRFLGGTPINSWPRGQQQPGDAPMIRRLQDAHANCLENLLPFAAIVLAGAALGRLPALQPLAPWVVYARVGQSLAHLAGTGPAHVFVRASFWVVQLALFFWMLVQLF